jgi:hypothetical protein
MIKNHTNPKKVNNNLNFIIFLRIRNSGKLSHTTAIIKAIPVQKGTHLSIRDSTIGTTLIALAYIGIHNTTETGTAKKLSETI